MRETLSCERFVRCLSTETLPLPRAAPMLLPFECAPYDIASTLTCGMSLCVRLLPRCFLASHCLHCARTEPPASTLASPRALLGRAFCGLRSAVTVFGAAPAVACPSFSLLSIRCLKTFSLVFARVRDRQRLELLALPTLAHRDAGLLRSVCSSDAYASVSGLPVLIPADVVCLLLLFVALRCSCPSGPPMNETLVLRDARRLLCISARAPCPASGVYGRNESFARCKCLIRVAAQATLCKRNCLETHHRGLARMDQPIRHNCNTARSVRRSTSRPERDQISAGS